MTPVVYRWRKYRFQFHSREESRPHLHITGPDSRAKIWLSPQVVVAYNKGVPNKDLKRILAIVKKNRDMFLKAWHAHHGQ